MFVRSSAHRAPFGAKRASVWLALAALSASACRSEAPPPKPDDKPAPSAATPSAGHGVVTGTIRVKGDPPPVIDSIAPKIPVGKCFAAHEAYGKLFREGPGRTLADVLVAATEYQGSPELADGDVVVKANDCAFDTRTVALRKGQTLKVQNVGKETYTPQLVGHPTQALLMAVPGGDPIEFTPLSLGQYQLVDRSHPFVFTDVMVLLYGTMDVTGLDGKYEIRGLPVGKAKLSALLPITGQNLAQEIQIEAGKTLTVDLEFDFDAVRDGAKAHAQPGDR